MSRLLIGRALRVALLAALSIAATFAAIALTSPAYALATYSATTEATLLLRQILDVNGDELQNIPDGVTVGALVGHAPPVMFDIGNADAHATPSAGLVNDVGPADDSGYAPVSLPGGLHVSMQVDGTADQATPPTLPSVAQSLAQGGGSVGVTNTSLNSYMLKFSLEWNYLLQTTLSDPAREKASADELIRSWAIVSGAITGPELLEFPEVQRIIHGNDQAMDASSPMMSMIEFRIDPNRAVTLNLTVQSSGDARNVPEPAVASLLLVAAAIHYCARRSRT